MKIGIAALIVGYVLSQFYRAFLAVLTPDLAADLGATPADLSRASGLWFLFFAAAQLPVGYWLDSIGPRRTAATLLAIGGGGGAAVFAMATVPWHISAAMILIGIGCSPVLMANYFIFARMYSPAVFATLAGMVIGLGSLGNIAGSIPLAWVVQAIGWRSALWGLVGVTLVVSLLVLVLVQDPPRAEAGKVTGSVLDILKMPAFWPILPLMIVNYAPAAGIRGVWAGPYMRDTFGLDAQGIGWVTLGMGLAMIVGNFAYGPMDRLFGTRKWVIIVGNLLGGTACLTLALIAEPGLWTAAALIALVGLFGSSYPMMVAHARSFVPGHLTGRGVTLMNLFSIGGVGVFQYASGRVHASAGGDYGTLFLFFGVPVIVASAIYVLSRDNLG